MQGKLNLYLALFVGKNSKKDKYSDNHLNNGICVPQEIGIKESNFSAFKGDLFWLFWGK